MKDIRNKPVEELSNAWDLSNPLHEETPPVESENLTKVRGWINFVAVCLRKTFYSLAGK